MFLINKIDIPSKYSELTYILNTHLQGKINLAGLKLLSLSLIGFYQLRRYFFKDEFGKFMNYENPNNDLPF